MIEKMGNRQRKDRTIQKVFFILFIVSVVPMTVSFFLPLSVDQAITRGLGMGNFDFSARLAWSSFSLWTWLFIGSFTIVPMDENRMVEFVRVLLGVPQLIVFLVVAAHVYYGDGIGYLLSFYRFVLSFGLF